MKDFELLSAFMAIEAEIEATKWSSKQQSNKTNAQKRANLSDEIFYYIHTIYCQRLFSLAWYNNMTYTLDMETGLGKALPTCCYNGPSCQSIKPKFF